MATGKAEGGSSQSHCLERFLAEVRNGIVFVFATFSVWGVLYMLWGSMALPSGGPIFYALVLEIAGLTLGHVAAFLSLPPPFGMLCAGLILSNSQFIGIDLTYSIPASIQSPLRDIAVVILLTKGALNATAFRLKNFKCIICSLAIGSCIIEALSGTLGAYLILDLPLAWAALLGCMGAAISIAAVKTYFHLLEIQITGEPTIDAQRTLDAIGIAKSVYGFDAIFAICLACCCLGFIVGEDSFVMGLEKGVAEVIMGGLIGICWGYVNGILLVTSPPSILDLRTLMLLSEGLIAFFGLNKFGHDRGAPLAVFLGTFTAVKIWTNHGVDVTKLVESIDKLWYIFQPFLFAVLGLRINFEDIDWNFMTKGLLCLEANMLARMVGSFLLTMNSGVSLRQRIFLSVGLCGKGTVQAALGPVALNMVDDMGMVGLERVAYQVMTLAAMTIFVSSIISSVVNWVGKRFLVQKDHHLLKLPA